MSTRQHDNELDRAARRLAVAHRIIEELRLLDRWRACGEPVVAGAVAYGLVVNRDIDLWVHAREAAVGCGMRVLCEMAELPGVRQVSMRNELDARGVHGAAVLHKIDYVFEPEDWQWWRVGVNLYPSHRPFPPDHGFDDRQRRTVLRLKELLLDHNVWPARQRLASAHVYRAVTEQPERDWTVGDLLAWAHAG